MNRFFFMTIISDYKSLNTNYVQTNDITFKATCMPDYSAICWLSLHTRFYFTYIVWDYFSTLRTEQFNAVQVNHKLRLKSENEKILRTLLRTCSVLGSYLC